MNKNTKFLILVVGLLPFVMVLGNTMLIPILPMIEEELRISAFEVGLLLSIFSIVAAVVIPIVGFLSDRYGRKNLILFSLALVILGNFVVLVSARIASDPYKWVMFGRIIQGLGAGGTAPMAMALIGDLLHGSERSLALGALEVFNGIGKVISPFIGAIAGILLWYNAFFFYLIISVISFIAIYMKIPDRNLSSMKEKQPLREYWKMIEKVLKQQGKFLFPLASLGSVGLFLLFGMLFYLSFAIEEMFSSNGIFKGIVFMFPLGAMTVISYWSGKNIQNNHFLMKKLLLLGITLKVLAIVMLLFNQTLGSLLFWLTMFSAGVGFILPCVNTLITSSVGKDERGMIVSVYGMIRFLGVAFGPIFFALWMEQVKEMLLKSFFLLIITSFWIFIALQLKVVLKGITSKLRGFKTKIGQ